MNMNSIINMIMRQVVRRLIGKGVNAGFNQAGKMMNKRGGDDPRTAEMRDARRAVRDDNRA